MFMEMIGYRVVLAVDAASALARAAEEGFDVLLTDIQMPDRDGWELLRELGVQNQLPSLCISMSCHTTGRERERSKMAGCQAHLIKPFKVEELERALRQAAVPV